MTWPKLSESLTGPRSVNCCQSCGAFDELSAWQEHDDADHPTPVAINLCLDCSDRIIKPHPRLYRLLDAWEPWPGIMAVCVGCRYANEMKCTSPLLKANGGAGLPVRYPKPATAIMCTRGRGCHTMNTWQAAPKCEGRTP